MFQQPRFDPTLKNDPEPATTTVGQKRRREPKENDGTPSLRVIAPEQKFVASLKGGAATEEAFEDLDIVESIDTPTLDAGDLAADEGSGASQSEIQAALHIAKMPIQQAAEGWRIAPFLLDNLKEDGFENFFPIQALIIPDVIASERHPHIRARDICITAPTGSGKTLSYVLPIVNSLANRQIRRLRALIVLPSRDLADQVCRVFQRYVQGSDLKVGLAVGQTDFKAEQASLTINQDDTTEESMRQRLYFDPGNLELALQAYRTPHEPSNHHISVPTTVSAIDILVCTPGRLVDHMDSTPGFTLQHLRFICIDEADRLLNQSYHNWFDRVIASTNKGHDKQAPSSIPINGSSWTIQPVTWRYNEEEESSALSRSATCCQPVQLRKFLVSATLTRDPQKLAALRLVNPKHFDLHKLSAGQSSKFESKKYAMPPGLTEFTVECTAEQKPVVLVALILDALNEAKETKTTSKGVVVVFTSSLDSTHRLVRLLQLLWVASKLGDASMIAEFSSSLNQKERTMLITRCKDKKDILSVVVCSDGMSRGMDIEYVSTVINYDVPSYAKTFLHRAGRTARANREGTVITLLKGGQVAQFGRMRSLIQGQSTVSTKKVKKQLVRDIVPHYRGCVRALKAVLEAEADGEMTLTVSDTTSLIAFLHDTVTEDVA